MLTEQQMKVIAGYAGLVVMLGAFFRVGWLLASALLRVRFQ